MTKNQEILQLAEKYGFDECEVISAEPFLQYKKDFEKSSYAEDSDITYDPKAYKKDADKIVVLLKAYNPYDESYFTSDHIYVDAYYVAGNECYFSAKNMAEEISGWRYAAYASPRISFRHCAYRAGMGKRGMSALLINEKYGSYVHIQCLLTNAPLDITKNIENTEICDDCESCTLSCKGGAMQGNGFVDINKCVRHYMPAKRYVPEHIRKMVGSSFIGCTDCRVACPHNLKIAKVKPPQDLLDACYIPVLADSEHENYKKSFNTLRNYIGTNEIKKMKLIKSVVIVIGNTKDKKYLKILDKLKSRNDDKDLLEYIHWAENEILKAAI
ncbi:MAG: epoxyqueuosine reductase [Clostridia bacterium]|nr:epoxyqueuosine reductase [Clostridia bacterium]